MFDQNPSNDTSINVLLGDRRIGPVPHPFHMTMLYRTEVNVIDVVGIIAFIAQGMFPITPLPDPA